MVTRVMAIISAMSLPHYSFYILKKVPAFLGLGPFLLFVIRLLVSVKGPARYPCAFNKGNEDEGEPSHKETGFMHKEGQC